MDPEWTQDGPRMDQGWTQNGPRIGPEMIDKPVPHCSENKSKYGTDFRKYPTMQKLTINLIELVIIRTLVLISSKYTPNQTVISREMDLFLTRSLL